MVLRHSVRIDGLVVEAGHRWLDIVSLSHLEVLSEVLVSAPPVGVDHADSLVSSHLMEIGVSYIVLLPIGWQTSIGMGIVIVSIILTKMPSPIVDHTLFLLLCQQV